MAKSYRKIEGVLKTGGILKYMADQKEAVGGNEIAKALDMPQGTVMSHLASLEELNFVTRVGERFDLGMGLALFWARKKSRLEGERSRIDRDIEELEC